MKLHQISHLLTLALIVQLLETSVVRGAPTISPSPIALLRGVEVARTKYDSLSATLEIRYILPPPAKTIECLVEAAGSKRRFEVFTGEVPGQVIIRDGDVFYGFRRVEHGDVDVYDRDRATGIRGDLAFDPHILGLSDTMVCDVTVKDCLWYENSKSLDVLGQETLHGVNIWRVRAIRNDDIAEFWIEEPSFRVHRKTIKSNGLQIEIESEYDSSNISSPFPSHVHVHRKSDRGLETIYTVKKCDVGIQIPPDRFTLKSMNLPINTMVNDYRINRIVGYWNGEGVSKNPMYVAELPSEKSLEGPLGAGRRWVVFVCGILLIMLIVVFVARRYRRIHA